MSTTPDKLREAVEKQIDQFRREFQITYSEAIGVLEMIRFDLLMEAWTEEHADDDQHTD